MGVNVDYFILNEWMNKYFGSYLSVKWNLSSKELINGDIMNRLK